MNLNIMIYGAFFLSSFIYIPTVAAKYGSIECMELLLSAGFNSDLQDGAGRTPLHYSAMNRSSDSVLCCSALLVAAKKSLNMRDSQGDTAVHLAVKRNNIEVFRILAFAEGVKLDSADKDGRSCRRLAAELQHTAILEMIDAALRSRRSMKDSPLAGTASRVPDTARIMQVWEKFFENAFKAMMAENEAEEGLMLEPEGLDTVTAMYSTGSSNHQLTPIASTDNTSSSKKSRGVAQAVEEWFSWYVVYMSGVAGQRTEGYYAMHARSGEIIPLQSYLQKQSKSPHSIFFIIYRTS